MLARIGSVTALDINYCVVLGGANDAADGRGSAATISDLSDICVALETASIIPIVGTILPRAGISAPEELETVTGTNAWLRTDFATEHPIGLVVDWNDEMAEGDETTPNAAYFADDVHPNSAGAAVMAAVLESTLTAL